MCNETARRKNPAGGFLRLLRMKDGAVIKDRRRCVDAAKGLLRIPVKNPISSIQGQGAGQFQFFFYFLIWLGLISPALFQTLLLLQPV